MFTKVYTFEFDNLASAKDASLDLTRQLSKDISQHNLAGLNLNLLKNGTLTINVKFDDFDHVQDFEKQHIHFVSSVVDKFGCSSDEITALTLYSFEREAATTELEL